MASKTNSSWGGRFVAGLDPIAAAYSDSQHFDRKLYDQDIRASIAHARMLGKQGIITAQEMDAIILGLQSVHKEIANGSFIWKPELEDVHMNIESRLTELIGDTGKKLHTGRSRNDQVGITFRLYVSESCYAWQWACLDLCEQLLKQAQTNMDTIMPGYTHLQPAQPVTLAQHLLAYAGMFRRDFLRLADAQKRIRISPLGAAALAGSTYPLDPISAAQDIGFPEIYANSMDAVSDRDFVLEALFCGSVIMEHLSRLCEEFIIWSNPAFGFISLPDAFSTGSSIMPQKKNPDIAELMRGKTGRVYGNLISLLTLMKSLPLTYNRDLQEDKESFFDTDNTVLSSLKIMAAMLAETEYNKKRMKEACKRGFLNATELADYLTAKGMPFRDAHHVTGKIVAFAENAEKGLEELSLDEFHQFSPLIERDVYNILDYQTCIARRETPGATGPESVKKQLTALGAWLSSMKAKQQNPKHE